MVQVLWKDDMGVIYGSTQFASPPLPPFRCCSLQTDWVRFKLVFFKEVFIFFKEVYIW